MKALLTDGVHLDAPRCRTVEWVGNNKDEEPVVGSSFLRAAVVSHEATAQSQQVRTPSSVASSHVLRFPPRHWAT